MASRTNVERLHSTSRPAARTERLRHRMNRVINLDRDLFMLLEYHIHSWPSARDWATHLPRGMHPQVKHNETTR